MGVITMVEMHLHRAALLGCVVVLLAGVATADWNVNTGSNINTAPSVVTTRFWISVRCTCATTHSTEWLSAFTMVHAATLYKRAAVGSSGHGVSTLDIIAHSVPKKLG